MPEPPSDHLLRVMGREAIANRVLDLGCGDGRHTEPLARLGFDVYACNPNAVETARARLSHVWTAENARRRITPANPDALGYPDEFFDWIIAYGAYDMAADADELMDALEETRRVMKDGAWIYVTMSSRMVGEVATPQALAQLLRHAKFASAGSAEEVTEDGKRMLRGIFRKVDGATPV